MNKYTVVIYTDASMRNKVAGWSAYIKISGNHPFLVSGICPLFIKTAAQAEAYAILKAIVELHRRNVNMSRITVLTDCMGLTNNLKPTGRVTKYYINKTIQRTIIKLTRKQGITLNVSYVRGHQHGNNKSAKLNRLVDHESKKMRREIEHRVVFKKTHTSFKERFFYLLTNSMFFQKLYFRWQLQLDLGLPISFK